jgi:hypothetical protein
MPFENGSRWAVIAAVAVALSIALRVIAGWVESRARTRVRAALESERGQSTER